MPPSSNTTYSQGSSSKPLILREQDIEDAFIEKLRGLKYSYRADIRGRAALDQNFRRKFEALNRVRLTDGEFQRLLDELITPDVFTAARVLREKNDFTRDDGTPLSYTLVNIRDWCKNDFEVVHQLRINTDYSHHRFDVILLINGVPVVQVELKTLGVSPRRAMEQVVEYKNDPGNGYTRTLLCFIQLFIVSNRTETFYFANNNARHFAFNAAEQFLPVYRFATLDNTPVPHLDDFAGRFLPKCTLGRMISRYMVLIQSEQKLLMMRPYQIYAVQAIVDCIEQNNGNGYIWHTTGSGKTLTSFKASTLLKDNPAIDKCLFVVDRKDLDRQTREEFNRFQEGCVEENTNTATLARSQSAELLDTLRDGFKYIENESFESTFQGLFSEINLGSEKLGRTHADKNNKLCDIIKEIAKGLAEFSTDIDALGDAYEYLIGQFAAGSGKKAGEFYTPQQISTILSRIVTLDSQEPKTGKVPSLGRVLDFACGSGSLLLNVRTRMGPRGIGRIYGQEKNITTYNLARMNMLLHGVKDTEFEIYHGDTLTNDWDFLRETNPARMPKFDAVVANPPFSYRWEPKEDLGDDVRFKNHGLAPKSAADFAFLLHGFHYLADQGVMAIILPHGVLFRGGAEERIRTKLLQDGHIDTVIGLPANLFYSTGIPVCILVLKRCKKPDDVLFINAAGHFEKGKRQNVLSEAHIDKIVDTYQHRREEPRYSKRVPPERIAEEGYNLNISRYISTAVQDPEIDLAATHDELVNIQDAIRKTAAKHNEFLRELGLPLLPPDG